METKLSSLEKDFIGYSHYQQVIYETLSTPMKKAIMAMLHARGYAPVALSRLTFYRYTYKHSLSDDYRIDAILEHLSNPLFTIYASGRHGIIHSNYKPYYEVKF